MKEQVTYRKPNETDLMLTKRFAYDHVGRLLQTSLQINGGNVEPIAGYEYDEIGRMIQKNLNHAGIESITRNSVITDREVDLARRFILLNIGTYTPENGTYIAQVSPKALQEVNYSYNVRGQINCINCTTGGLLDTDKVFSLKLDYFEDSRYFNGNLSKVSWQNHSDTLDRSFVYDYDFANRFVNAKFTGHGDEKYDENVSYDANGNIETLNRFGLQSTNNWQRIDSLTYSYGTNSNQLTGVLDKSSSDKGHTDNGNNTDYTYYDDGSLRSDGNKGITNIIYNYLGLPDEIQFGASQKLMNIYMADGQKLSQLLITGTDTSSTDYMGALIYKNDTLRTIWHAEGRVLVKKDTSVYNWSDTLGNSYSDSIFFLATRYQYFINDHLGNARVVFEKVNDSLYLAQTANFYSFGGNLEGLTTVLTDSSLSHLFQSKKYIEAFGYNTYDFHSRQYDANLGRFTSIDPRSQFASGYVGMGNNPVMGVDPNGEWVNFAIGAVLGGYSGYKMGKAQGATGWGMAGFILSGASIGTITAGVGTSVAGATAAWGSVGSGIASGATAGFVGGFYNSALSGNSNPLQSGLRGAAIGGGIGGALGVVKAGFNANKTLGEIQVDGNLPTESPVDFSRESFNDFLQTTGLSPDAVNTNTFLSSEATPNGLYFDKTSKLFGRIGDNSGSIGGTVKEGSFWQQLFSSKTNTYIAEGAFRSGKLLYIVTGHEFIHAYHASLGINIWKGMNTKYSEHSAYGWSIVASKSLGYGDYLGAFRGQWNSLNSQIGGSIPSKFLWHKIPGIIKK